MIYCTQAYPIPSNEVKLYEEWTGTPLTPPLYPEMNTHLILAKDDDKIIGVLQLIVINDAVWSRPWGLVENVYVAKDYRRKGVGKKLMCFAEEEAYLWGCDFIKLTSSKKEGQALYRSLGYKEGCSFKKRFR